MPRLAVRFDLDADLPALQDLAARWEAALGRSSREVLRSSTILPHLAAVQVQLPFLSDQPQSAASADGMHHLWLDGELWNRGSAAAAAGLAGPGELTDAELCLRAYLKSGDRFVEQLNGQFVLVVYDAETARLLVCNDRYAFRPFFWHASESAFTCASEAKHVLSGTGEAPRAEAAGIFELLAYGYQLGETTLFEGIHALLPGSRLVYQDGRVSLDRYWRYRYAASAGRARETDMMEELAARLRAAATRQARGPGRVGFALSGGLDSRAVFAAVDNHEKITCAYTHGYPDSLDLEGGRRLAARYRVPHHHVLPREGYLGEVAPEVVWRSDACFCFHDGTGIQFHPQLRPQLDVIVTGHSGGALSGQTLRPRWPLGESRMDLTEYLYSHALILEPELLADLLAPRLRAEALDQLRARFAGTVEELGDQRRRLEDAAIAWNMERRQPRFIHHTAQADRYDFEVRAPFLDNDVVDFFLTVPYRYRYAQRLLLRTLATHFPEAAQVPWAKTGQPLPGTPLSIQGTFYLYGLQRKLIKAIPPLARRHRDRERTSRLIGEELRRDPGFRATLLDPFVNGDLFPEHLLDRSTVRRILDEHWSGQHDHADVIGCLTTLALGYSLFLGGGMEAEQPARAYAGSLAA